jgi:hypothetical protein
VSAPAIIVGLAIEHRTSEDWLLRLPIRLGPVADPERPPTPAEDQATATALIGATAQLRLAGTTLTQAPAELLFAGPLVRIEAHEIVTEAPSTHFSGKAGRYQGEVLVRLANGFDFVSHVVELDLKPGLGWVTLPGGAP